MNSFPELLGSGLDIERWVSIGLRFEVARASETFRYSTLVYEDRVLGMSEPAGIGTSMGMVLLVPELVGGFLALCNRGK